MASKIARLSETERFIEPWHEEWSLYNILSDNYKIRQEKEKSVERISEKLEMTSKKSFLWNVYLNPRSVNERHGGLRGIIFRTSKMDLFARIANG